MTSVPEFIRDMPNVLRARAFAVEAHGEQKYGDHPYAKHLDDVAALVQGFGEEAVIVAYLHDVLEDTMATKSHIAYQFDGVVAWQVAELTDPPGANRRDRKGKLYSRLRRLSARLHHNATVLIVKTADRLANVLECKTNNSSMLKMYQREHAEFRESVFRAGLCDDLWKRLDEALS